MKYMIYRNISYLRYYNKFSIFNQVKKIVPNSEPENLEISRKDMDLISENIRENNTNIKIDRDFSFSYWTEEPTKKEKERDINTIKKILKEQENKIKKEKTEKIEIKI